MLATVPTATMIKVGSSSRQNIIRIIVLLASAVSARSVFAAKNESVPMVEGDSELTWREDFLRMPASGKLHDIRTLLLL